MTAKRPSSHGLWAGRRSILIPRSGCNEEEPGSGNSAKRIRKPPLRHRHDSPSHFPYVRLRQCGVMSVGQNQSIHDSTYRYRPVLQTSHGRKCRAEPWGHPMLHCQTQFRARKSSTNLVIPGGQVFHPEVPAGWPMRRRNAVRRGFRFLINDEVLLNSFQAANNVKNNRACQYGIAYLFPTSYCY